jgi:hypothetical protein
MDGSISGRCLCGQVTYEYVGSIGPANYCHCEDCRRCTGSAFNVGVRLRLTEFRITSGQPKGFTKWGDSERELTRHFCPECGSPLYTSAPKHPGYVYVKAGTLDDPSVVQPTHQNWVASAVPWSRIAQDLRSFAKGPESDADRKASHS